MILRTATSVFALMLSIAMFSGAQAQDASPPAKAPLPAAPLAAEDTLTVLGLRPMETLRFVNPVISGGDAADNKEAWVHLRVTVSAEGNVTNATVIEAFPKQSYEKAVLKVATGWRFQPPTKDGKLVDGASFDVGVAFFSESFEDSSPSWLTGARRTVSPYNYTTLDKLIRDLTGTPDLAAAGPRLAKLRQRYEDGDMTITDIARYFAAMARYERMRGNYNVSLAAAHGALLLSRFLDNRNMIYSVHLEIMSSLLSMGRNDDAVDYYSRWRTVTKIPMSKEGQDTMEQLRAQGAGKGYPYTIVDFDAAHRYEKKHVAPRMTQVCFGIDLPGGPPRVCGDIPQPVLRTAVELISFDFPDVLDPGPNAKPIARDTWVPAPPTAVQ